MERAEGGGGGGWAVWQQGSGASTRSASDMRYRTMQYISSTVQQRPPGLPTTASAVPCSTLAAQYSAAPTRSASDSRCITMQYSSSAVQSSAHQVCQRLEQQSEALYHGAGAGDAHQLLVNQDGTGKLMGWGRLAASAWQGRLGSVGRCLAAVVHADPFRRPRRRHEGGARGLASRMGWATARHGWRGTPPRRCSNAATQAGAEGGPGGAPHLGAAAGCCGARGRGQGQLLEGGEVHMHRPRISRRGGRGRQPAALRGRQQRLPFLHDKGHGEGLRRRAGGAAQVGQLAVRARCRRLGGVPVAVQRHVRGAGRAGRRWTAVGRQKPRLAAGGSVGILPELLSNESRGRRVVRCCERERGTCGCPAGRSGRACHVHDVNMSFVLASRAHVKKRLLTDRGPAAIARVEVPAPFQQPTAVRRRPYRPAVLAASGVGAATPVGTHTAQAGHGAAAGGLAAASGRCRCGHAGVSAAGARRRRRRRRRGGCRRTAPGRSAAAAAAGAGSGEDGRGSRGDVN